MDRSLTHAIAELSHLLLNARYRGRLGADAKPSTELAWAVGGQLAEWYEAAAPGPLDIPWVSGRLKFYAPGDLWEIQAGYRYESSTPWRIDAEWDPNWLVIGDCAGDPIVINAHDHAGAVMMAPHGAGSWGPLRVASSLAEFLLFIAMWLGVWSKFGGRVRDDDGVLRAEVRAELLGPASAHLTAGCRENLMQFIG